MRPRAPRVQVMDTTLRDGEQTPDVSYTPDEKLQLAQHAARRRGRRPHRDRAGRASPRASARRRAAVAAGRSAPACSSASRCSATATATSRRVGRRPSAGACMNLLVKGSERHCRGQLRMTPEQHRDARRRDDRARARSARIAVNVYLEDWSSGVTRSPRLRVRDGAAAARALPVERIYLADTLGILLARRDRALRRADGRRLAATCTSSTTATTTTGSRTRTAWPPCEAGARGVHTSVNGMGERAGNTRLAEVVAALHDHTAVPHGRGRGAARRRSRGWSRPSAARTSRRTRPIVGRDVFTQTAGIHADGDAKGDLYASRLAPDRFGARAPATRSASSRARRRSTRT